MPETAVDEDGRLVFFQYNVGGAGQFAVAYTIAQTPGKQVATHSHFRLCVFAPDSRHAAASFLWGHCIHVCLVFRVERGNVSLLVVSSVVAVDTFHKGGDMRVGQLHIIEIRGLLVVTLTGAGLYSFLIIGGDKH